MLTSYDIKPDAGLGDIKFGMPMEEFIAKYGKPDEIDEFDEDEEMQTTLLHYWEKGFSVFFVGLTSQILAGIETDHPETSLFGIKIMGLSRPELEKLMESKGYSYYESEQENNDIRLSYDVSMMDFFFRDNKLIYMNFGVLVNENGEIETVEN
ncbi:MAG: hypothetical protein GXO86_07055 [Chlorobi bacterium]|nr:hypothetical protein [Chlorobiota bacterium]